MSYPEPKFCGAETEGEIHGYYDKNKNLKCPKCTENRTKERIGSETATLRRGITELETENEKIREVFADYPSLLERLTKQAKELRTRITELENLWIKVSERLPRHCYEDDGEYLVRSKNGSVWIGYWSMTWGDENDKDNYGWTSNDERLITHWMPIPKLVKEK